MEDGVPKPQKPFAHKTRRNPLQLTIKKHRSDVDESGGGLWETLSPEVLALIFVRFPADELLRVIPFVCKSWNEAVTGPYCWTEIDLEQWCRRSNNPGRIEHAVRKLVKRSNETCRRLCAYKLTNAGFAFVANCVKCLKDLKIPMSDVTDKVLARHTDSLKLLTFLDLSYCLKVTRKGLEALGKHCSALVHLRRNMPPPEWQHDTGTIALNTDDGEALVIADTMPGLRHLELGYGRLTDYGLDNILTKCKKLTHLDIIGCYGVKMEGDFEERCNRLVVFRPPWDDEYQDLEASESSEEGEEYFSTSDSDSEDD